MMTKRFLIGLLPLLTACGAVDRMSPAEPMDPPGPGESKIVVFRLPDRNELRSYAFYDGMELVGWVETRSQMEYLCSPGQHVFLLKGVTDAAVHANLEAGKTYHLRVSSESQFLRIQLVLTPVTPEELEEEEMENAMTELQHREPVPEGNEEYIREHWEEVSDRLTWYSKKGLSKCGQLKAEDGK